MNLQSINPYTGNVEHSFNPMDDTALTTLVQQVRDASPAWGSRPLDERCEYLRRTAGFLRQHSERFARTISGEMGKPIREARAEVEKCAWGGEILAERVVDLLADELLPSDATRSLVSYQPIGTLLAIMPWNFPFWQVFRACAPAIAAGNTVVVKHASNVPQCALAIDEIFSACFPPHTLRVALIGPPQAERLIADPRIRAVTVTGSESTGRRIAAAAGASLKKSVLELGGSDAFVVLADADLDLAVAGAVASRFQNAGQSCISAKRIIVVPEIAEAFVARLDDRIGQLRVGDPMEDSTDIGPLARADLRDQLERQVQESVRLGARRVRGGHPLDGPGYRYSPTLLDGVKPGMPAHDEELFGPVAAVIRAGDEEDALRCANNHRYGLGGSVWTRNPVRGEALARRLECGQAFVNGVVKSDPRLPFGGIKDSGYGRELALAGIREFVNIKTLWIR